MTDKKQLTAKNKPVHTITRGEVTASIFQRQSNAGYVYWDFSLGRTWRGAGRAKESHGTTFFAKHEKDISQAVHEACQWLRGKNHAPATEDVPDDQTSDVAQKD
jgi:hypothetical protein